MSRVSVIIPSYNCASHLAAALDSVLAQTYSDLEIIVVDDGSTDGTVDVIAPYLDRVQYIQQNNKGLPGARNAGIQKASGEYIALLDADDTWVPQKLEQQLPRFADREVGIVYSDFAVQYADGRYLPSYLTERPLAAEGHVFDAYIQSRFLFPSTMLLRRSCIEECGLFDEEMLACEDIELFARICVRWKVALVNDVLMVRNEGAHNITANQEKMSAYTILALKKILAKEVQLLPSPRQTIRTELGRQYWWRGYADYKAGRMVGAREAFKEAIRYDRNNARSCVPLIVVSYLPTSVTAYLHKARGLSTSI